MLGALGNALNGEYNNAGELLGLGDTELVSHLNTLDPVNKARVIKTLTSKPASIGSRAEFEKFFKELPQHIKNELLSGKLRLADHLVYSIKPVGASKTIKMFESQDVKEKGLRNISGGKLPKNMAMLVSGIYILTGAGAAATDDDAKTNTYDVIDGALATGEITLKANKKQILAETSMRQFRTTGLNSVPVGYYKLANPRLIHDDVEIELDIELGSVTGIAANSFIYAGLHGTVTIP